ncbi:acidic skeletal organic matrix protein-like isoform X1 [Montipora capricornis]|uniref:acidic skeletal organic matrix protein-like isoform X1 n=2 Tax=Montipora capricornis TaxID=246305 RepID=UPI0035F1643A
MLASRLSLILLISCLGAILITSVICDDEVDEGQNTVTMRGSDTSVKVEGDTGKISTLHFEQDDDDDDDDDDDEDEVEDFDDDDALSFQVESLREVDGNGISLRAIEPSAPFKFSELQNSTKYQNLTAKTITLVTTLPNTRTTLELMVVLFLENGTITFGNETFNVLSGTMKFNINITGWETNQAGENLELVLSVKSQAEEPEKVDDDERADSDKDPICVDPDDPNEEDDDCPIIYNMGANSEMVLNRGVLVNDGNYVKLPAGFPKFEVTGFMSKRLIYRLPLPFDSVLIDPSVNVGASTPQQLGNGGTIITVSSLYFFILSSLLSILVAHF